MKRAAAAIAAVGLVGVALVVWRARAPAPATSPPEAQAEPTAPPPIALAPAPVVASPPMAPPPPRPVADGRDERPAPSEPALMATLREMGGTAPERSIALARDGQRRFAGSGDAPERAFIIVQSLVNLRRFHEAREEAREMVRKYPDNPFALDAQRHLLVYPLDQPSREEMQQRDQ